MGEISLVLYADDGRIMGQDHEWLQYAMVLMVDMLCRMGLEANLKKTKPMVCTPRFIWGDGRIRHIIDGKQVR